MLLLGFDPGLLQTGFGVIDAQQPKPGYVASGIIDNQPLAKQPLPQRLAHLHQQALLIMRRYQPAECAMELVFSGPFAKSALSLAMARGSLLSALGEYGVELRSYAPKEVKLMIAGQGRASKAQLAKLTKRHLNLSGELSADAADALAVALCLFYDLKRPH